MWARIEVVYTGWDFYNIMVRSDCVPKWHDPAVGPRLEVVSGRLAANRKARMWARRLGGVEVVAAKE